MQTRYNHIYTRYRQASLWGIMHGLNDLAAGYLLANFAFTHSREDASLMLIVYAILGFGGQLPLALFIERQKTIKPFAITSIFLLTVSLFCFSTFPMFAICITGIAGAGIHVTGGAISLQVSEGKASVVSLFTAPGVLGLTIGGLLSGIIFWPLIITAVAVAITALIILKIRIPEYQPAIASASSPVDRHDLIMLSILVIMCFRSFIFDLINIAGEQYPHAAVILGVSAFSGKLLGGFFADKFGWRVTVYTSLCIAFILLQFSYNNLFAMAFATACLQSSVPVTLMMMAKAIPRYPATATALSLGVSVAIAGLPVFILPGAVSSLHFFVEVGLLVVSILAVAFFIGFIRPGLRMIKL